MAIISNQERLAYALRQLRTYNKLIRYSLPEKALNVPLIEEGFNAPFDSEAEKRAKKMLVAASTEAIMSNPGIPSKRKAIQARRNAEEIQQAFDAAKLDFAEISVPEREERIKHNAIAKRAQLLQRGKRALKRKGAKLAINAAITAIGVAVGTHMAVPAGVVYAVATLIPDEWKRTIKAKAVDVMDRAARTVEKVTSRLMETPVARRLTQACQQIQESKVVRTVREGLSTVGRKAAEVFDTARQAVSRGAKRTWDFVKSLF